MRERDGSDPRVQSGSGKPCLDSSNEKRRRKRVPVVLPGKAQEHYWERGGNSKWQPWFSSRPLSLLPSLD